MAFEKESLSTTTTVGFMKNTKNLNDGKIIRITYYAHTMPFDMDLDLVFEKEVVPRMGFSACMEIIQPFEPMNSYENGYLIRVWRLLD